MVTEITEGRGGVAIAVSAWVVLVGLRAGVGAVPWVWVGVVRGDGDSLDLDRPWVVEPEALRSKSKNTPFDAARLQGRALLTFVAGRLVYNYAE